MTDTSGDWLTSKLYEPYSAKEMEGAVGFEKDDEGITPVGHNYSVEYIGMLFGILVCTAAVMAFNGFLYGKFFRTPQRNQEPGESDEAYQEYRDKTEDELRYHPTMYWGSFFIVLCFVTVIIMCVLLALWVGRYNPTLRRENIIGRNISVAMGVGNALENTSDLLATYVHPLSNQEAARNKLSTNLRTSLGNALSVEQNVTRKKYGATGSTSQESVTAAALREFNTSQTGQALGAARKAAGKRFSNLYDRLRRGTVTGKADGGGAGSSTGGDGGAAASAADDAAALAALDEVS